MTDSSDTLLIGRKMSKAFILHFEGFKPVDNKYEFAQKMVNIPKVIFTRTLYKTFGKNTTLAKGNLAEEITKLKTQEGKDILVFGEEQVLLHHSSLADILMSFICSLRQYSSING